MLPSEMIKKYNTYKDSGIEWIGKIPQNWNIVRLKFISNITTGNQDTIDKVENGAYPFFVRSKNVERINNYAYDGEAILTAGDGDIGKIFHYINGKFNYHQRVYCISDFKNVVGKYLYYYTACNFIKEIEKYNAKTTVDSLRLPWLLNFPVLVTSKPEQQAIADYLDKKCGEIDKVVETEEAVIEKLKEYKQSIITEAVTKGLDKSVQLKDSGIEYLGNIPSKWNIKRLRYIATCQNGISKGGEFFGEGSPFVTYGDVYNNNILPENVSGLCRVSDIEKEHYSVQANDIFFTRTSETIEEIALTCVCKKTIPDATFAGFLIRVRPYTDELLVDFSKYYFASEIHRKFFVKEMNLVIRASLSQDLLKKLPILIPPKEEQQQIADYLDKKCSEIDQVIAYKEQIIEKLTEYKKSLIYECVTGKKEVA